MEVKAALYEKMARGEIEDEDDDEEGGRFLVDFHKKVYSKDEECHQDLDELKDEDIPPPSGPEEEWVDYVDSLGRERRCLRKDLKHLQEMDKDMNDMNAPKGPPTLLSEDMRRDLARQEWEKEEEEAMNKPIGPVHYQDIRFDEIRNHGVGYYQFSTNEEERQQQMKTLDKLRDQTMEQRVRTQKLKDKRKAALDARLAKVRERKLKKLKASGELSEESIEKNGQLQWSEKEQKDAEDTRETTTSEQNVAEGSREKEEVHVDVPRRPLRKEDLPEWARHKIKQWDQPRSSTRTDPRSERDLEFAPPSFYYEETSKTQNSKNTRKESQRLFNQGKEIKNERYWENETREISHHEEQKEFKSPEQQQQVQRPLQTQPVAPYTPEFPRLPPPPQEFVQPPWSGCQWRPPPNIPPPPLPAINQVPWQPNFPYNVPPPPIPWQPRMTPWQPYPAPSTLGKSPVTSAQATQSSNPSNNSSANVFLSAKEASDGKTTMPAEDTENTNDRNQVQCRDKTVPSTEELASFVAQFRSST